MQAYAVDTLRPLYEDVEATAPDELSQAVEPLGATVDDLVATGGPGALDTPEMQAASEAAPMPTTSRTALTSKRP